MKPTGKFENISDDAIVVCKTLFAMMTPESTLTYHNRDTQAPPRLAAALKELVERGVVTQRYNGIIEIYSPARDVDFAIFRNIALPEAARDITMHQNVDPTKPLDLLPPSWAGSMIDNYRRSQSLPAEVTNGMIFARIQECGGMDPADIEDAVGELRNEVTSA